MTGSSLLRGLEPLEEENQVAIIKIPPYFTLCIQFEFGGKVLGQFQSCGGGVEEGGLFWVTVPVTCPAFTPLFRFRVYVSCLGAWGRAGAGGGGG